MSFDVLLLNVESNNLKTKFVLFLGQQEILIKCIDDCEATVIDVVTKLVSLPCIESFSDYYKIN
jgi:hypothetical protein